MFPQAADASEAMVLMQPGGEGADSTFLQQHCSSLLPLFAVETLAAACVSAGVSIRSDKSRPILLVPFVSCRLNWCAFVLRLFDHAQPLVV